MTDKQVCLTLANCTKCGVKHSRPVGIRCKRQLNISAPLSHPAPAHSDGEPDETPVEGGTGKIVNKNLELESKITHYEIR